MEISVEAAILAAMRNSIALTALVPVERITNDAPGKNVVLPAIALFTVGGSSRGAAGYNNATVKRRDNKESWQVSVLASSKVEARKIVQVLDRLFIPQVAGMVLVERTNDADAYESVPGRWHMPPRYQGEHTIVD